LFGTREIVGSIAGQGSASEIVAIRSSPRAAEYQTSRRITAIALQGKTWQARAAGTGSMWASAA
jgi:hypothetical protein